MAMVVETFFWGMAKLLLVGAGILYVGLVLMAYRIEGPRARLRFDALGPALWAENLLVWLGIKSLAAVRYAAWATLDILSEASAEVGEWFIRRRGAKAGLAHRSRYI